jgi:hypothetical protein
VYVVGNEESYSETIGFRFVPVLRKNGVKQRLDNDGRYGRVCSLFVSDGDVYAAGYVDEDDGRTWFPALWINGETVDLRPSGMTDKAFSVFVAKKE